LTPHTSRSTTSIQMDADHTKTRRKILDLRGQKARTKHMTPRETITTPKAAIQAEATAGAETKIDLYIVSFTRETQTIREGICDVPPLSKDG
jgi:hypothetical protein